MPTVHREDVTISELEQLTQEVHSIAWHLDCLERAKTEGGDGRRERVKLEKGATTLGFAPFIDTGEFEVEVPPFEDVEDNDEGRMMERVAFAITELGTVLEKVGGQTPAWQHVDRPKLL